MCIIFKNNTIIIDSENILYGYYDASFCDISIAYAAIAIVR